MVEKVISGGQTGVDQAALYAAEDMGIQTGGWMPKGFITQAGPRPEFAERFGMQEDASPKYPPRTRLNVAGADGTLRIATNFNTAGEKCTLRAIKDFERPYFDLDINTPINFDELIEWVTQNNIKTLNVAGNSERSSPGIFDKARFVVKNLIWNLQNGT